MNPTPVNRLKEYQGPKNHGKILKRIFEDAQKEGIDISPVYIRKVIYLFFSLVGICHYFVNLDSFEIGGIGKWVLTTKGRKARRRKDSMAASRKRRADKRQLRRYRARCQAKSPIYKEHDRLVAKFNKLNEDLLSRGGRPWEWRYFCMQNNRRLFIKWGTETGISRKFDPKKYIPLR